MLITVKGFAPVTPPPTVDSGFVQGSRPFRTASHLSSTTALPIQSLSAPSPPLKRSPASGPRQPIHPALASPPNSPPTDRNGGSPYHVDRLASPPNMIYTRPSALHTRPLEAQTARSTSLTQDAQSPHAGTSGSRTNAGRRSLGESPLQGIEFNAAGPSSIPLPPNTSFDFSSSPSSTTPRASWSKPLQSSTLISENQPTTLLPPRLGPSEATSTLPQSNNIPRSMPVDLGRFDDAEMSAQRPSRAILVGMSDKPVGATKGLTNLRRPSASSRGLKPQGLMSSPGTPRSTTITRPNAQDMDLTPMTNPAQLSAKPSSYFPSKQLRTPTTDQAPPLISEASAYARSVASTLAMSYPATPARPPQTTSSISPGAVRRVARPLPQPPSGADTSAKPRKTMLPMPPEAATVHVIASSEKFGRGYPIHPVGQTRKQSESETRPMAVTSTSRPNAQTDGGSISRDAQLSKPNDLYSQKSKQTSSQSAESADIEALPNDRRLSGRQIQHDTIGEWAKDVVTPQTIQKQFKSRAGSDIGAPVLSPKQVPPRLSAASASDRNASSLPLDSTVSLSSEQVQSSPQHISSSQHAALSQKNNALNSSPKTHTVTRRGEPSMVGVLQHQQIQAILLSHLPINSFLSLIGASDIIRRLFTGETVGRWVMGEWGLHPDREKGRSWPNLTVWEGFRKSMRSSLR